MKLSDLRTIKNLLNDYREAWEQVAVDEVDFEVDSYRFIHKDNIDAIMCEELESDEYVLGCFNAGFIAEHTDIPLAMIEACQKSDAFQAIGEAILNGGHISDIQEAYASADGYGHHFNHWDGSEEMIGDYYVFRT